VNELFAPLADDWQPASPVLATYRRTLLCSVAGLLAVVTVVGGLVVGLPGPLLVGIPVALVVVASVGWVLLGRNARSWAYAEREEDLYVTHGLMFRRLVVVPYGRMQYVDVNAGPLEQAFGVASVHLHTASPGTSAHIPGLPKQEAARLRDRLTSLGESQAAGL
jgi:membrane protein YdbS with pleckstrin-like domain